METLIQILFISLIIFLIVAIYGIYKFITVLNDYKYMFENENDEIEIPPFINIDSNIINTDVITNIAILYDNNGNSYRIIIETIDKKEPIIFSFDTSDECNDVFEQLTDILDSKIIVID